MITLLVVAVLGVVLILVLKKLFEKPPAPPPKPVENVADVTIADARTGDSISVSGAGDEFADLDFTVENRNDYSLGPRRWLELRGMYKNRRVVLEVSVADEVEIYAATDGRRLTLDELALNEDDLGQLDERQNTADFFAFDDKNWYYCLSREFAWNGSGQGASFYGWLFREEGTGRALLIRKSEGEAFNALIGVKVNPGDVTVYRA